MGIHVDHLRFGRSAQRLNDIHELVDVAVSDKIGLSNYHLKKYAACRPDIYHGSVCCGSEDKLRGSITPGAYVSNVGLPLHQLLG